jgi:tRNA(Ile)-lysidine synthase
VPLSPDEALALALRAPFAQAPLPQRLGVAVSGGGDSMALLHLLADWARDGGPQLAAVTVDHGLRAEAVAEAALVARVCVGLGIAHRTLSWNGRAAGGNVMDAARRARLRLIGEWAGAEGIGTVALGHTSDDQAETVLMRLARGSGVDGLSGMAIRRHADGLVWLRPLLGVARADLRGYLRRRGAAWVEDPTNDDPAHDRTRARRALAVLEPLGIDRHRLAETAALMALARDALERTAQEAARETARIEAGDVVFRRDLLLALPMETQLRLLAHAIRWLTGAEYRPRLSALEAARTGALDGRRRTLAGCLLTGTATALRVGREPRAAGQVTAAVGGPWDGRWIIEGPAEPGLEVRAMGEAGLATCADWRGTGLPRATLLAAPAVWRGAALIAAPLVRTQAKWRAGPLHPPEQFFLSILSH